MFSARVLAQEDVDSPKNGPVPIRSVNGCGEAASSFAVARQGRPARVRTRGNSFPVPGAAMPPLTSDGLRSAQGVRDGGVPPSVRCARRADLPAIVRLQMISQPHFFWTEPGPAFLRAFYAIVLRNCRGLLLVSEQDGSLGGFVVGVSDSPRLHEKLAVRRPLFFAAAAAYLLRHPVQLPGFFKDIRRATRLGLQPDDAGEGVCELVTIAVQPRFRRQGHGKTLVLALVEAARSNQVSQIRVNVDKNDEGMMFFYRKFGFEPRQAFKASDGRWVYELSLAIQTSNAEAG